MVKSRTKALATLFVVLTLICPPALGYEFKKQEYEAIRDTSLEITQKFADSYYLGVGRSPTPIIAFLQNYLGNDRASNLPISSFKALAQGLPPSIIDDMWASKKAMYAPLTHDEELRLFRHFDRFFPKEADIKGKKILLIDYAYDGGSIIAAWQALENYLKSRDRHHKLEVLALSAKARRLLIERVEKWGHSNLNFIEFHQDHIFYKNLFSQKYEKFAEYPSFIVRPSKTQHVIVDTESINPRPEFITFKKDLIEEMKRHGDSPKAEVNTPLDCDLSSRRNSGSSRKSETSNSLKQKACALP
ncbi:MAG: hypothetical protein ABI041_15970 [Bdellovibrionia bacterium]